MKTLETVANKRTGNIGVVISRYNRRPDNKPMVQVRTLTGHVAHWEA